MTDKQVSLDIQWVRQGREHWAARRWDEAQTCFETALRINPKNTVAKRRLEDLNAAKLATRPRVEQVCVQCRMSISMVSTARCAVCNRLLCPQGHCLCTNSAAARPVNERACNPATGSTPYVAHCWACSLPVSSDVHSCCDACGWVYCLNGHCGCGYGG